MTVVPAVHPESKSFDNNQNLSDVYEEDMKPVVNTLGFVLCVSYLACLVAVLGIIAYDFYNSSNIYDHIIKFLKEKYPIDENSSGYLIIKWMSDAHKDYFFGVLSGLSILVEICFYAVVLIFPEYSFGGNKFIRALPLLVSFGLYGYWSFSLDLTFLLITLLIPAVAFAIKYAIFAIDNDSDSIFLALKPWVFKKAKADEESA